MTGKEGGIQTQRIVGLVMPALLEKVLTRSVSCVWFYHDLEGGVVYKLSGSLRQ